MPDSTIDNADHGDQGDQPQRKGVRERLDHAEAEVARLTDLLASTRQRQLERLLDDVGVEHDYASVKGVTVDAHLDEDGHLDLEAARAAAEAVRQANPGTRRPRPNPLAGAASGPPTAETWKETLFKHANTPRRN